MDIEQHSATARRLMLAFRQLQKAEWHQRSFMGYKPSEIRVLFCIKAGRPGAAEMKVSDISKYMHVTSPTITQLAKSLEADGLIERQIDQADRRVVYIKLTEKGEMITQRAGEAFFIAMNGLIEYLGEEKSNQLADLLTDVFAYFHEKEASSHQSQWSGDNSL